MNFYFVLRVFKAFLRRILDLGLAKYGHVQVEELDEVINVSDASYCLYNIELNTPPDVDNIVSYQLIIFHSSCL